MADWRQAAQQALEALENSYPMETTTPREHEDAITALRAALAQQEPRNQCGETCERAKLCAVCAKELAQQEQEPVAWIQSNHLQQAQREPFLCRVEPTQRLTDFVPLYTQPPRALRAALSQQEQEPLSAEVERLRYLILEIAGAMRTKAANNPYIKATTLDALADELLAGISAALAQQEQATGKESLQVEFRGGGQIATPLQSCIPGTGAIPSPTITSALPLTSRRQATCTPG